MQLTFSHPKSTVRILHMLMHLSLSHRTLLQVEFHSLNFSQIGLTAPGGLTLGFALNLYFFYLCVSSVVLSIICLCSVDTTFVVFQ